MSAQGGLSSYAAVPGKYSFIHKVIDGITVIVNVVNIMFNSPAFVASVQVCLEKIFHFFVKNGTFTFFFVQLQ